MPQLTAEQLKAAAEKRKETKRKKDEAENALSKLDKEQKDYLVSYLLNNNRERCLLVVDEVLENWTKTFTDDYLRYDRKMGRRADYKRQLDRVRDAFGTNFEREGEPRFRQARISVVVAALVKFCLSAGYRDTSNEADLGFFAETADEKTATALLGLAPEGEGVAVTEAGYNQAQMLLRMISEQFGEQTLGDKKVADLVEAAQDGLRQVGKAGPIYSGVKGIKTYKEREAAKRRKMTDDERIAYDRKIWKEQAEISRRENG